ncbi:DUF6794 domain-containing protein [Methylomarinum vadi]|uniref:DUF6794 domain-containing protein n=1 Tax=Methylomarinum vadi TaxID=438855 RepID=UPI0004DFCBAC|nr:DUF6794 domain-containing protein [Methylomarinum vadi]
MPEQCPEQLKYLFAPPKTLSGAIKRLSLVLSNEQKLMIALMSEHDLIDLRYTLGVAIRKAFSLDNQASSLLVDCGTTRPEQAADIIIREVWKTLTE